MPKSNKTISPAMDAATRECFQSAASLVPKALRPQFVLVGGSASIAHGSTLWTEDVDIAASLEAQWAFEQAIGARTDPRFKIDSFDAIQFEAPQGFNVDVDILRLNGDIVTRIVEMEPLGEGFVSSIPDLLRLRAITVVGRGNDGDLADFRCVLKMMGERGLKLPHMEEEEMRDLVFAAEKLEDDERDLFLSLITTWDHDGMVHGRDGGWGS